MYVLRKGNTARKWSDDPSAPAVTVLRSLKLLHIGFWMPASGGITDIGVLIESADFEQIIKHMVNVAPDAAIRAIGAALADYKPKEVAK
jgi:hypothetical protein